MSDRCFCRTCQTWFKDESAWMGNFLDFGANRKCAPLEALRGAGLKLIDPKNPHKGWRL